MGSAVAGDRDQFEELSTHGDQRSKAGWSLVTVLERLSKSGVVWVVCAMRSDFTHKLESMHLLMYLAQGEAKYHLNAPEAHEFGEIVAPVPGQDGRVAV